MDESTTDKVSCFRGSMWGGRPPSATDPWSGFATVLQTEAGVGRGPGGPPYTLWKQDTGAMTG
jgi:hypothetical protein